MKQSNWSIKKHLIKTMNVTGGLLVAMILVGSIANSYGVDIKITYITTPAPFIFALLYLILPKT